LYSNDSTWTGTGLALGVVAGSEVGSGKYAAAALSAKDWDEMLAGVVDRLSW
jgi:hypothetical protein